MLVVVLGTNGPGSMIGFDYARTENPAERLGSASGVVNVGGFVASLLTILAIGAVLDLLTPGASTDYSLDAFRAAFSVQYVFWAIGLVGVLRHRRELRARLARDGVVLAPLATAVRARLRGGSAYPPEPAPSRLSPEAPRCDREAMNRVTRAAAAGLSAVAAVAVRDLVQREHSLLRNFPVLGHARYLLESIGPELRQYLVAGNNEERPFTRDQRRWVYASAKGENNYFGFGTDNDLEYTAGYPVINHRTFGRAVPATDVHAGPRRRPARREGARRGPGHAGTPSGRRRSSTSPR